MTLTRPIACVSLPGGATHVATLAGAACALGSMINVPGWSGVSAGALVAIAKAFNVDDVKIKRTLHHLLRDNRMLDVAPFELGDLGICSWQMIPSAIDELIGKGARMGDAHTALVVCATDLSTGKPVHFSRKHTPHALVREVARASSAFPFVAPQVRIPSHIDDERLYTDGGVTDNTTDAVWDAWSCPRVAVRLTGGPDSIPVHWGDPLGQALALVRALQWGSKDLKSQRQDGIVIDIDRIGDGMDFSLSPTQIDTRWSTGYDAVVARKSAILALSRAGEVFGG
jgi:hypothetical protein